MYWRGGRGSGKTKTASWNLAELIVTSEPGEWAVVAPTFGDARDICMEGQESGLIVALGGKVGEEGRLVEKGPYIASWVRSLGHLRLRNGSIVYIDGADDGAYRIQGHNLRGIWGDEVGLWKKWKAAYKESIRYAVRLAPAKVILTGTPKRSMPARVLVKELLNDASVVNIRLRTIDNADNLDADTLKEFLASQGTALERQELEGELLDEVDGALWTMDTIDSTRMDLPEVDDPLELVDAIYDLIKPLRVVVAVDPAVSYGEDSDEHGIIVVAKGADGDHYVLEDLSRRSPVTQWPRVAIDAHARWQADRIVAEVNNGGDYVEATVRSAGYRGGYEMVRATRGKQVRADPIAQFYAQGHVHHVGYFERLEEQLVSWVPDEQSDESPDRLDALVWGCVFLDPRLTAGWADVYRPRTPEEREREGAPTRGWGTVYAARAEAAPESSSESKGSQEPSARSGYFKGYTEPADPKRAPTYGEPATDQRSGREFCRCGNSRAEHAGGSGACSDPECSCQGFVSR